MCTQIYVLCELENASLITKHKNFLICVHILDYNSMTKCRTKTQVKLNSWKLLKLSYMVPGTDLYVTVTDENFN